MVSQKLCPIEAIKSGESAGFVITVDNRKLGIMAIRQGDVVFTYVNSCPHVGTPLDFKPGQFLDMTRLHILCSSHGALFRISDGYCLSGPCAGKSLKPVANEIRDGTIYIRP